MIPPFNSTIQYCPALAHTGDCGYCGGRTRSKWYDVDLRAQVCGTCFLPALAAERQLVRARFQVPGPDLCHANP